MLTPEEILRTYFRAKDENRPHLLEKVFSVSAELEVRNDSASIAFPALTVGREEIADVLVRRFAQTYENVYSFYMARPPEVASSFSCDWLVCMSDKESKETRVGCGRYDWEFQASPPGLASRLVITIRAMQVLPPRDWEPIAAWFEGLRYPWESPASVLASPPDNRILAPVLHYLGRGDPGL